MTYMHGTLPVGFLEGNTKQVKYRTPPVDVLAPIKIRDVVIPVKVEGGQRIISARAIVEAMADGKFTEQDLPFLILEELLLWGDCRID